jgi:plasmid stabilization system protein ParE
LTGKILYSDAAERDLRRIAIRIAADDPQAALRFVAAIREHCLLLARVPFMGRQRADIHPDIRSFPHGPMWSSTAGGRIMAGSKSSIFGMVGGKRQQRRT